MSQDDGKDQREDSEIKIPSQVQSNTDIKLEDSAEEKEYSPKESTPPSPPVPLPQDNSSPQDLSDRVKRVEKWDRLLALALVLVAFLQWYVMQGQKEIMDNQLKLMIEGEEETKKLIAAAADIRDSMAESVKQSQLAMEASIAQSKVALDASIKVARHDQRAWVGMVASTGLKLEVGLNSTASFIVLNAGKTPALKVAGRVERVLLPKGEKFVPVYTDIRRQKSVSVIQPGTTKAYNTVSPGPFTKEAEDVLKSNSQVLYFYGKFDYEDVFKQPHHSTFCMFLLPDLKTLVYCDVYNEAD